MAWSIVDTDTVTVTATSITGSLTGLAEDDQLFAIVHGNTASKTPLEADATDWTLLRTDNAGGSTCSWWHRTATASEPATYAFKHSDDSSDDFSLTLFAVRGAEPLWILDPNTFSVRETVTTTTDAAIISRVDNVLALSTIGIGGTQTVTTPPTDFTLVAENDGFNPGSAVYYKEITAAGTTGAIVWTLSGSTTVKQYTFLLRPSYASTHSLAGPNVTGTAVNTDNAGGNAWSSPQSNVTVDDGSNTSATVSGTTQTDFLDTTNYGFAIPSDATITGVVLSPELFRAASGTTGDVVDAVIQLIVGGSATGDNKPISTNWPTTMRLESYGDYDDLWGTGGLTPAQVNASDFGARIAVAGAAALADRVGRIDYVRMFIYYTEAAPEGAHICGTVIWMFNS